MTYRSNNCPQPKSLSASLHFENVFDGEEDTIHFMPSEIAPGQSAAAEEKAPHFTGPRVMFGAAEAPPEASEEAEAGVHAAFIFIKPHAANDNVKARVEGMLGDADITVIEQGRLGATEIDERLLIDTHYGAIANRAVRSKPAELNVPLNARENFENLFGMTWVAALEQGLVVNATDAAARLNVDAAELEVRWRALKNGETLLKFGGGFYCGKLSDDQGEFFVINAFYLNMRADFTVSTAILM